MKILKKAKEYSNFKWISEEYDNVLVYGEYSSKDGYLPKEVVEAMIFGHAKNNDKPFRGFTDSTLNSFLRYFEDIDHNHAKRVLSMMVVFGLKQGVEISDYNDETITQFIEQQRLD